MNLRKMILVMVRELREIHHNRWFFLLSFIFTLLILALSLMGMAGYGSLGVTGFGRTALSLLNLVLMMVPLMGLLLGAVSLSGEVEQGTMEYLMSHPVSAFEVMSGKFAALAIALSCTICFGFGLNALVIAFTAGSANWAHYLHLFLFTILLVWVNLAIGLAISSFSRKSAASIGVALFLWFILAFLGDLGLMRISLMLKLVPRDLLILVMVHPIEVAKLGVLLSIQGDLEVLGPVGRYISNIFGGWFILISVLILGIWIGVCFLISYVRFKKSWTS